MKKREVLKPVGDAVNKAKEDDLQLTEKDKEILQVKRNLRMIKALWNPSMPETKESLEDKHVVLSSILNLGFQLRMNHQEIADWIFAPEKVDVEKELEHLWLDPEDWSGCIPDYTQFLQRKGGSMPGHIIQEPYYPGEDSGEIIAEPYYPGDGGGHITNLPWIIEGGPKPEKIIELWVTPDHSITAAFTKIPDGEGYTLDVWTHENGIKKGGITLEMYRVIPKTWDVADFAEANAKLRDYIAELRGKDKYKVTDLVPGEPGSGSGDGGGLRPGEGPLDVGPGGRVRRGPRKGPKEGVELDYSELLKKLGETSDMDWVLRQLKLADAIPWKVQTEMIKRLLGNKNLEWSKKDVFKLFKFAHGEGRGEFLDAIIGKAPKYREFIDLLAWNLHKLMGMGEGESVKKWRLMLYLGELSQTNRVTLYSRLERYKVRYPDRYSWLDI